MTRVSRHRFVSNRTSSGSEPRRMRRCVGAYRAQPLFQGPSSLGSGCGGVLLRARDAVSRQRGGEPGARTASRTRPRPSLARSMGLRRGSSGVCSTQASRTRTGGSSASRRPPSGNRCETFGGLGTRASPSSPRSHARRALRRPQAAASAAARRGGARRAPSGRLAG